MRWVRPAQGFFVDLDVPKLQHIPILIGDGGSYPVEANRYLVERSCGEWAPRTDDGNDPTIPTAKSRENMASRLCAFFYWCEQDRQRDWRKLEYVDHLLGEYQTGLLSGKVSASARSLEPATVNLYLDEACAFLTWAADRGYRGPFKVPQRRARVAASGGSHSLSHLGIQVSRRHGKLSEADYDLDSLPIGEEVSRWLRAVHIRHPVKALMFELMLRTGTRISEANQLRVSCFPRRREWKSAWIAHGKIPVKLRYGVKGPKVQPASQLSTRSRAVQLPIDLAERIEHYLAIVRPTLLARFHVGAEAKTPRTDRLWLGEHKGQPVSNQMLYKAWTATAHCPDDWHPHAGRHFFAVEELCEATRQLLRFHQIENPGSVGLGWLHGLMAGQVKLILSPLLGHVSEETTMRYLRCAQKRMVREFGHPALNWNAHIDSDLGSDDE